MQICRSLPRHPRGTATIEFALALPLLALLRIAMLDLGIAAYEAMEVQAAAEAGAQYAALNPGVYPWDAATVTAIANAVTGGTAATNLTATPAPSQVCACAGGGALAPQACTSACADGSPAALYAVVNAELAHWSVLPYPGVPSTLSGKAWRRLQ